MAFLCPDPSSIRRDGSTEISTPSLRRRGRAPAGIAGGLHDAPGDKSKYTDEQKRKAAHIADGYAAQGVSDDEAERIAWATVDKDDDGGKRPGRSGRAHPAPDPTPLAGGRAAPSRR